MLAVASGLTFIRALFRGASWVVCAWRPLGVHMLGISELAQGIVFNGLLIAAFLVHF
jgi:hypothetical protein